MSFNELVRKGTQVLTKHAPAILTGIGVAGVITTSVLAVKATPQAHRDITEAESERTEPLTPVEKVRLVWYHYLPAGSAAAVTIAAIVCAQSLSSKRQAALVSAYIATETTLREWKDKTQEIVGEKKVQEIKDEIAQDHLMSAPMVNSEIIITGSGDHLCYDSLSGRTFRSSHETIRKAINDINFQCNNHVYASLNDFYALLGLERTALGDDLGWTHDHHLDIHLSSHLVEGTPCLSLEYLAQPLRNYDKVNR